MMRSRLPHAALVVAIAAVGLIAAPGTASAAGTVEPIMNCYIKNDDTSRTLVLGYVNSTQQTRVIPVGSGNSLTPSRYRGVQPTSFDPGTASGVFTVRVTEQDLKSSPGWVLDGTVLDFQSAIGYRPVCPSATELPEEGNGTGPAIALVAAGVVGAVAVQRVRRRAQATADVQAGAGPRDA